MNLILLTDADFVAADRVRLTGRRLDHVREFLRPEVGRELQVGVLNGRIGRGRVERLDESALELTITLERDPPPPLPVTLVLALPRPPVMDRSIAAIASLGIKEIILLKSWRVEKQYWQSPRLRPENLHQQLILGLEQSVDTVLPTIRSCHYFNQFITDEAPPLLARGPGIVATPEGRPARELAGSSPRSLIIGPEGGFIPDEVEALVRVGFTATSVGPRILRVETAIPYLVARFFGD